MSGAQQRASSLAAESAHLLNDALSDLARAILLVRLSGHLGLAEFFEPDLDAIVANHVLGTIQLREIQANASRLVSPGLYDHVPWLLDQLAEREIDYALLRLQLAFQLARETERELLAADVGHLTERWALYWELDREVDEEMEAERNAEAAEITTADFRGLSESGAWVLLPKRGMPRLRACEVR
ncbi:hypothetical protein B0A55_09047 [Friedmanniomyces simplex]|uniref:Uncharacterized protein n=1 Tax=Friedmanniomyces simplex TaxID=329884 RepID=A0A4U0WVT2_9PEZI|nr:hypothetical protein B0A55_09047 [Friedmanniomyces simplex]